jgi:hypothetical protein
MEILSYEIHPAKTYFYLKDWGILSVSPSIECVRKNNYWLVYGTWNNYFYIDRYSKVIF